MGETTQVFRVTCYNIKVETEDSYGVMRNLFEESNVEAAFVNVRIERYVEEVDEKEVWARNDWTWYGKEWCKSVDDIDVRIDRFVDAWRVKVLDKRSDYERKKLGCKSERQAKLT